MGSPMEINGGSVVAMIGKDCVAIASDLRLGASAVGLSDKFEKVSIRSASAHTRLAMQSLRGNDEESS